MSYIKAPSSILSSSNLISCFKRIKLTDTCKVLTTTTAPSIITTPPPTRSASSRSNLSNNRQRLRKEQVQSVESRNMQKQFTREWKVGDVYAPHDLSSAEARRWKKKYSPTTDAFDALNLNPLDLYKNFAVMSEYMTEMGRIRPRTSTGLRRVNQRKIAKAIRRAIALGLMPSVHRHPEIIRKEMYQRSRDSGGKITF